MDRAQIEITGIAAGGDGIARDDRGRVMFVSGGLPGELVVAQITEERKDFARAEAVDVLRPSPHRAAVPCGNVRLGCGGCGWLHVSVDGQHALKEAMAIDALRRIAKLSDADLPRLRTVRTADRAFRTTVRVAVEGGRARFRKPGGNGLAPCDGCLAVDQGVGEVLDHGDLGAASEAIVRTSVATGATAVLLRPTAEGVALPAAVEVVVDGGRRRFAAVPVRQGVLTEEVAGRRLEVSIRSFFQAGPVAATALVEAVLAALEQGAHLTGSGIDAAAAVVDLYGGAGLFAVAVHAATGAHATVVESNPSAAADARVNLQDARGTVVQSTVSAWRPETAMAAAIADPGRPGLARPGVAAVTATAAPTVVLVSCDVASWARDVALLGYAGMRLASATLVDAFPHTPHVEVVSLFVDRNHEK